MAKQDSPEELLKKLKSQDSSNTNSSTITYDANGKVWIIPEQYHIIKYVTIFGNTKFKEAGGLPFIKFPWRQNIEIIDKRDKIINLPQICDFKTQDGASVVADLYVQYTIENAGKYISNQLGLQEKISENVKSIMQQYFRNTTANDIAKSSISMDEIGRDNFSSLEEQYGIHFTRFGTTKLKLPELDDDKTKRLEMQLKMQTKKEHLTLEKETLKIQRKIAEYTAITDNKVREKHYQNIIDMINSSFTLPDTQKAELFQKLVEIDKLFNSGSNVTYISGAENINSKRSL